MEDVPSGPLFISSIFDPGDVSALEKIGACLRRSTDCAHSLSATEDSRARGRVRIHNHVLSDISNPDGLSFDITESNSDPAVAWCRGV